LPSKGDSKRAITKNDGFTYAITEFYAQLAYRIPFLQKKNMEHDILHARVHSPSDGTLHDTLSEKDPSHRLFTPRLRLRRFVAADAPLILALNSDPEVMRYTGDARFTTVEEAQARIARYDAAEAAHGFSRWAVFLRESGAFLGSCGLAPPVEQDGTADIDLGYRFMRKYWGQGYATESARAVIHWAFEVLMLNSLVLKVEDENTASVAVFHKLGAVYEKHDCDAQGTYAQYRLTPTTFSG